MKKCFVLMLSLVFCIAPCFMLTACKEKQPTEAEVALQQIQSAVTNTVNQSSYEMTVSMTGEGGVKCIHADGKSYLKISSYPWNDFDGDVAVCEVWTIEDYYYIVINGTAGGGKPITYYFKKLIDESFDYDMSEIVSAPVGVEFISSTTEEGVTTLVFSSTDMDETMIATYVIENNLIVAVTMEDSQGNVMGEAEFAYEGVIVPSLPTGGNVYWNTWPY